MLSFVPQRLDLALYSGDPATIGVEIVDWDDEPVDLRGEWMAQIRAGRRSALALAVFGIDTAQAADGIVILTLTGQQTEGLLGETGDTARGVWDVRWVPAGAADPITIWHGRVSCVASVSRPVLAPPLTASEPVAALAEVAA